jgi:hypothetical protein
LEDVDYLAFLRDCLGDYCLTVWSSSSWVLCGPRRERSFDCLEEADVAANRDCFFSAGTECEGL